MLCFGIVIASFFRFTGINWDENQHLHPDERFLTMVGDGMKWPGSLSGYLDTDHSLLNPHNIGNGFYVYGTFPVIFTKWVADLLHLDDYTGITLVGRVLSGLVDVGTTILVFLIAETIRQARKLHDQKAPSLPSQFPFLAMLLYATCVLSIQLSHFFAVDTYLTFFLTLALYALSRLLVAPRTWIWTVLLLGISFGLAIAAKISALFFLPIIGIALLLYLIADRHIGRIVGIALLFTLSAYVTVRLAYPYLFATPSLVSGLNPKVLENWRQLKSFDDPRGGFPPGVQWITTKAYVFPLKNLFFWGLGLPLGLLALASVVYVAVSSCSVVYRSLKQKHTSKLPPPHHQLLLLCVLWVLLLFGYQGAQFAKTMRYFHPLYPELILIAAYGYYALIAWWKRRCITVHSWLTPIVFMIMAVYPLSFVTIYLRPNSRIDASRWMYEHIPPGSSLAAEHWDDALPVNLPDEGHMQEIYPHVEFPLYWPDNQEKWKTMDTALQKVDYVVLTSNRLYGSLLAVPAMFPVTNRYYHELFDGSLGFEKVAEFTSRPNVPLPIGHWCLTPPFIRYGVIAYPGQDCPLSGISFVDDYADEMFTVYDHPKVIIFQKKHPGTYTHLIPSTP